MLAGAEVIDEAAILVDSRHLTASMTARHAMKPQAKEDTR